MEQSRFLLELGCEELPEKQIEIACRRHPRAVEFLPDDGIPRLHHRRTGYVARAETVRSRPARRAAGGGAAPVQKGSLHSMRPRPLYRLPAALPSHDARGPRPSHAGGTRADVRSSR